MGSTNGGAAVIVQKGVFGEQITAHKTPIIQIINKYKIDPASLPYMEVFSATGGTVDNNKNLFRCQSGTSVGGYGVTRSLGTLNYKAGQGVEGQITAKFTTGIPLSLQFAGMFSITETLAFGYDGADFSILHSYGGEAEMQCIEITATGAGTCTVTLDGDAVGITVTNSTVQTNAEELRAGLFADATLTSKWRFEQTDDKVYCIAKSVGDKTGTMSVSGGVTANIVEKTTGVDKIDNHVAQASWNVTTTPFAGFDPTKINIYKVQFGYLGAANIDYSMYNPNTGDYVLVHRIKWANANTVTNLGTPDLKIGWTAASLGASGTNLTVEGASASIMSEGDEIIPNDTHALDVSKATVGTTLTNVVTIRNRIIFSDVFNHSKINPIRVTIDNDHTKGSIIEIYKNATIGGTQNYQYESEFESVAIYDSLGTTVTGGELVDAITVPAGGDAILNVDETFPSILPDETYTIAAKTVSGTATNITVTFTWGEDK